MMRTHFVYPTSFQMLLMTAVHVRMTWLASIISLKHFWIECFAQWAILSKETSGIGLLSVVYFNSSARADERRKHLYAGHIFIFSPRQSTLALCGMARELVEKAFSPLDPQTAQHKLSTEEFTKIIAEVKPRFAHHPKVDEYMRAIFEEFGCDASKIYYDVPKMRFSTSNQYLTKGLAQVWHPHRDTWYAAPQCQLNWWIPIYPITSQNGVAFHTEYFNRAVENDSEQYNYYEQNRVKRQTNFGDAAKGDPRRLPAPTQPIDMDSQLNVVCPAGGIILFSGAQLHSSVPNSSGVTRFSFDFRTVHEDDVRFKQGASKVDERCTGTSLRDFKRATDQASLPSELISMYDDNTAQMGGDLVYVAP
jgi:Phytanoyl-CoA dioxygenase (PhyH)